MNLEMFSITPDNLGQIEGQGATNLIFNPIPNFIYGHFCFIHFFCRSNVRTANWTPDVLLLCETYAKTMRILCEKSSSWALRPGAQVPQGRRLLFWAEVSTYAVDWFVSLKKSPNQLKPSFCFIYGTHGFPNQGKAIASCLTFVAHGCPNRLQ